MRSIQFLYTGIFCCLFLACQKDDAEVQQHTSPGTPPSSGTGSGQANYQDPEVRPYVLSFITEMQQRGFDYRNTPLRVTFVNKITAPNSSQFCAYGYPYFGGSIGAAVEIIDSDLCWHGRTDTEKENLIYHELGHALLSKPHEPGYLPNGAPASIMCSSDNCNNYRVYHQYQTTQRTYYLDQLAYPSTPAPPWASEKSYAHTIAVDPIKNTDAWHFEILKDTNNEEPYTFFIEKEQTASPPFALGIASSKTNNTDVVGYWYRYFDISDFTHCSNVVVRTNVTTKDLTEGYAALVVDLTETKEFNATDRFARYTTLTETAPGTQTYIDFETTAICLTPETKYIKVLFYMYSHKPAEIYLDDLILELHQ